MNKKELVKEKIGKVAMQCFTKFGLDKTTLDDIAKAVGLNKASLYYYYKNKEDIFLEVAMKEGQDFINSLQSKVLEKTGTEERIGYYMQERFDYYKNVLNLNRVSSETLNKLLPKFFELYDAMMKQEVKYLTQLIKDGVGSGELQEIHAGKLASSLISISDALKHSVEQKAILRGESDIDYSDSIREMKFLVSLIFKGLRK
ncbi:MAG: TetR/AcrR family transcriptional regulator [Puia sp.]|nr:TetR/AcrR family transcriptional regulator [Puia sp.]